MEASTRECVEKPLVSERRALKVFGTLAAPAYSLTVLIVASMLLGSTL